MANGRQLQQAMFGAGCFWGVQYYFDQVPGVVRTVAGYSGGHIDHPTYEMVITHTTGHAEVVRLEFDPLQVSYQTLVRHFFRLHDPTLKDSDGINYGDNYRSCAFYFNAAQQVTLLAIRDEIQQNYDRPITTEIAPAGPFWEAEAAQQKFTERTGIGMCHIPYRPLQ